MAVYLILKGGLGNQLFQYAAGLTFGGSLYLYPAQPNIHTERDYRYLFKRGFPINKKIPSYTFQQIDAFNEWNPMNYERPITLDGYFQNLSSLKSVIYSVIVDIKSSLNIQPNNKTFIHVRRGDYLNYPNLFGGVEEEYYKAAMTFFPPNTEFILLSDDVEWCKLQKWLSKCKIIDEPDEIKALTLMASCQGGAIIANSTFSWWGAVLSENKRTIYPSKWFSNVKPDLFPEDWICI
jgi:hypothetical protein